MNSCDTFQVNSIFRLEADNFFSAKHELLYVKLWEEKQTQSQKVKRANWLSVQTINHKHSMYSTVIFYKDCWKYFFLQSPNNFRNRMWTWPGGQNIPITEINYFVCSEQTCGKIPPPKPFPGCNVKGCLLRNCRALHNMLSTPRPTLTQVTLQLFLERSLTVLSHSKFPENVFDKGGKGGGA